MKCADGERLDLEYLSLVNLRRRGLTFDNSHQSSDSLLSTSVLHPGSGLDSFIPIIHL